MEKVRISSSSSKHLKKRPKRSSKKSKRHRRSPYDDDDSSSKYKSSRASFKSFKIVEYSDVSSEDFSAPEAGEIQDEENSRSLSDREMIHLSAVTTGKINNGILLSKFDPFNDEVALTVLNKSQCRYKW